MRAYDAGKVCVSFTMSSKKYRPNQLWVSDFTYVSTWQGGLYVAFVIDVFARRIVGWCVSNGMQTDFVLDALERALYGRQPEQTDGLIHHSGRGGNTSLSAIQSAWPRPAWSPLWAVVDCYDNALAETINGLYKTEVIHRRAPWKSKHPWNWPRWNGCRGLIITVC